MQYTVISTPDAQEQFAALYHYIADAALPETAATTSAAESKFK